MIQDNGIWRNRIEFVKTQKKKKKNTSYKRANIFFKSVLIACTQSCIFKSCYFFIMLTCSVKCFICSIASRLLSSGVFVRRPHCCLYFQILYNTIDFCKCKLNLIWSCKRIIWKRTTEHFCWSVGVLLTRHIKFCMCDHSTPKQILACVGTCECDRTPFINRPA